MKQELKSKAHLLKPTVQIGKSGLTEALISEIKLQLKHHKLIKIKLMKSVAEEKVKIIEKILKRTGAELIQKIGSVMVLHKK
ncbi:MAG: ribosome assembly RNA-binding protein YhbY [Nanoarchaeota archaeon]|nr:ribosome assembly RNA-binding protein YhbY [Nanoarchaeota archaeon]